MKRSSKLTFIITAAVLMACFTATEKVAACATCFGKSDSALAEGMNMGIMTLMVFLFLVLGGVGAFFIYLARRMASVPPITAADHLQATVHKG